MIQPKTNLKVADNTGAKLIQCFRVLGGTRRRYAQIGDVIVASVKAAEPRHQVKTHEVVRAVVVRQTKPFRRKDGSYIRFDENAVIIVDKKKGELVPRANRIFGPIPREIAEAGHQAIVSMAPEVI